MVDSQHLVIPRSGVLEFGVFIARTQDFSLPNSGQREMLSQARLDSDLSP
jgi:hypothetical protein